MSTFKPWLTSWKPGLTGHYEPKLIGALKIGSGSKYSKPEAPKYQAIALAFRPSWARKSPLQINQHWWHGQCHWSVWHQYWDWQCHWCSWYWLCELHQAQKYQFLQWNTHFHLQMHCVQCQHSTSKIDISNSPLVSSLAWLGIWVGTSEDPALNCLEPQQHFQGHLNGMAHGVLSQAKMLAACGLKTLSHPWQWIQGVCMMYVGKWHDRELGTRDEWWV